MIINDYDITKIIAANEKNGWIGDHVEGNPDANLIIVEYSDYQCSACKEVVDDVDELLEKYGDKIAIVHRSFILSYHKNGVAAATAAEAAGLQGYWKEYGDYLFENQSDWYYSDTTERTTQFIKYFKKVTNDKGDVDKFKADMAAENTKAKVDFDMSISKALSDQEKISYTPSFFIGNELIDFSKNNPDNLPIAEFLSKAIDEKLEEQD